jgi:hypothetical protein
MSAAETPRDPANEAPGPLRTWWHPMLVAALRWALGDAYEVRDEVSVGRIPPQLDVLILRRMGKLPEIARRELAPLLPLLSDFTLIQFKGPTDALGLGDLDQFLGCVHLFRGQQHPPVERGRMSMVILAPSLTRALRADAERLGLVLQEREAGIWQIANSLFPLWMLETDQLASSTQSLLAFFSREFLEHPRDIIEHWRVTGHANFVAFIVQQIQQFRRQREDFAMQHIDTHLMDAAWEDIERLVLSIATPQKRLEGIPAEVRLEGLSPEERLEGLSPEVRLEGLSDEELQRLQELLQKRLSAPRNPNDS